MCILLNISKTSDQTQERLVPEASNLRTMPKIMVLSLSCVLHHWKDIMYQKNAPLIQLLVPLVSGHLPMSGMTKGDMYSQICHVRYHVSHVRYVLLCHLLQLRFPMPCKVTQELLNGRTTGCIVKIERASRRTADERVTYDVA